MARRLQKSPVMSETWIKKVLESQRRRHFHDVIVVILLAGGMAISLGGLL